MAWGDGFEIYVFEKLSDDRVGETISCIHIPGENKWSLDMWTEEGIYEYRRRIVEHLLDLDVAIATRGVENICVRTNH